MERPHTSSPNGVEKLKKLYKDELGMKLTDAEARDAATRVLQIHLLKIYEGMSPEEK